MYITVWVKSANIDRNMDVGKPMDPYVEIQVGGMKLRTATLKNGGTLPVWNDKLVFPAQPGDAVVMRLYDQDMIGSDFIGEIVVPVNQVIAANGNFNQTIPFASKHNGGTLSVNIFTSAPNGAPLSGGMVGATPVFGAAPIITPPPIIAPAPVITPPPIIAPARVITPPPIIAPAPVITPPPIIAPAPVITPPPVYGMPGNTTTVTTGNPFAGETVRVTTGTGIGGESVRVTTTGAGLGGESVRVTTSNPASGGSVTVTSKTSTY